MMTEDFSTAFRSKRLVYRAMENNEQDRSFLNTQIQNDAAIIALAEANMVKPKDRKFTDEMVEGLSKTKFLLIICLSEDETAAEAVNGQGSAAPEPKPIGMMVVGTISPPTQVQHRSTEIGLCLAAAYQNQGYGGEAINWALDWSFKFGGYHRVAIRTLSYNERGMHLYKKLGFVEEGREREAHWFNRKWYDRVNYGMLENEWATLRGIKED